MERRVSLVLVQSLHAAEGPATYPTAMHHVGSPSKDLADQKVRFVVGLLKCDATEEECTDVCLMLLPAARGLMPGAGHQ